MPPSEKRVVFVSYTHADGKYCRELEKQLRPLFEKNADVEVFVDARRIQQGEAIDEKVDDALRRTDVAVVLVSSDYFVSEYVRKHELPVLLGRAVHKRLRLIPAFVSAAAAYDEDFEAQLDGGRRQTVKLTAYLGANPPTETLDNVKKARRAELLAATARQVKEAVRTLELARGAVSTPTGFTCLVSSTHNGNSLHHRFETGGATLANIEVVVPTAALTVGPLALLFRVKHEGPLQTLIGFNAIARHFANNGNSLPSPSGLPLALLLRTSEPSLLGADWSRLEFDGVDLTTVGWSVAIQHPAATFQPQLDLTSELLVLAHHPRGKAQLATHAHAVAQVARKKSPTEAPAPVITSATSLRDSLTGQPPSVLYCCAQVALGPSPGLQLADGVLPFEELTTLLATHRTGALVLSLANVVDPAPIVNAVNACASAVPFVVLRALLTHATPEQTESFQNGGRQVAEAVLFDAGARDPVHEVRRLSKAPTWVWSAAARVRSQPSRGQTRRRTIAKLLLARMPQKSTALGYVNSYLLGQGMRVCALVAYGEDHTVVEAFSAQCLEHLHREFHAATVTRLDLRLDDVTALDHECLPIEVAHRLGCEPTDLARGLADASPKGDRNLLLVDFGSRDPATSTDVGAQIEAWSTFCMDSLASAAPVDNHLLCVLSVRVLGDGNEVKNAVDAAAVSRNSEHATLQVLARLDLVRLPEIVDYIRQYGAFPEQAKPQSTSQLIARCAQLLHDASDHGRFDRLVALIDRHQESGWVELIHQANANISGGGTKTQQSP